MRNKVSVKMYFLNLVITLAIIEALNAFVIPKSWPGYGAVPATIGVAIAILVILERIEYGRWFPSEQNGKEED